MYALRARLVIGAVGVVAFSVALVGQALHQRWLASTTPCATLLDESELEAALHAEVAGWRTTTDARGCVSVALDRDEREIGSVAISRTSTCSSADVTARRVTLDAGGIAALRSGSWDAWVPVDESGCVRLRLGDGSGRSTEAEVRAITATAASRGRLLRDYVAELRMD